MGQPKDNEITRGVLLIASGSWLGKGRRAKRGFKKARHSEQREESLFVGHALLPSLRFGDWDVGLPREGFFASLRMTVGGGFEDGRNDGGEALWRLRAIGRHGSVRYDGG